MSSDPEPSIYFEDVAIGDEMKAESFTFDEESIIRFAKEFDPMPFHLDAEAANETMFKGLIASGAHTIGAWCWLRAKALAEHADLAGYGFDKLRFHRPVRPGDVLRLRIQVIAKRDDERNPERGLVTAQNTVVNQRDERVLSLQATMLFARRHLRA